MIGGIFRALYLHETSRRPLLLIEMGHCPPMRTHQGKQKGRQKVYIRPFQITTVGGGMETQEAHLKLARRRLEGRDP